MRRLLPRLNHLDGLHVAGDYTNGYGHEARSLLGLELRLGLGLGLGSGLGLGLVGQLVPSRAERCSGRQKQRSGRSLVRG